MNKIPDFLTGFVQGFCVVALAFLLLRGKGF